MKNFLEDIQDYNRRTKVRKIIELDNFEEHTGHEEWTKDLRTRRKIQGKYLKKDEDNRSKNESSTIEEAKLKTLPPTT